MCRKRGHSYLYDSIAYAFMNMCRAYLAETQRKLNPTYASAAPPLAAAAARTPHSKAGKQSSSSSSSAAKVVTAANISGAAVSARKQLLSGNSSSSTAAAAAAGLDSRAVVVLPITKEKLYMKSIVGLHGTAGTAAAAGATASTAAGTGGYSFVGEDGEDELSTEVLTYTIHNERTTILLLQIKQYFSSRLNLQYITRVRLFCYCID
jgi:hypothetical protein